MLGACKSREAEAYKTMPHAGKHFVERLGRCEVARVAIYPNRTATIEAANDDLRAAVPRAHATSG
jgi:hypothetical protein